MRFLKNNTAIRLTVGPFFDRTDGVTPEVALTVTAIKLTFMVDDANVPTLVLDTNPTASGGNNDMVHVTGDDAGFYDLELTAANTNFLGRAMLALTDAANHCPVFHEFMILPAMIYDSLVLGTDRLDTNVTHIADTSQTARDIGASVLLAADQAVNASKFGGTTVTGRDIGASVLLAADQAVNVTKLGGTTLTARDIGASVLLSPGTGTGQVDLSSGKVLLQATQTGVTIPTVTTLTNAPSDSSGVTTLLSRLSALRAGYLDNLSAGAAALESSLQALITTVGAAGAGLTATASAVWSVATRLLTAGTNIVLAKGTGVTGFNDLSAAAVNAEVDTALADYDGPTHAELTSELASADDATLAAIGSLNNVSVAEILQGMFLEDTTNVYADAVAGSVVKEIADNAAGSAPTAADIADAVWDETTISHPTGGTMGEAMGSASLVTGYRVFGTGNVVRFSGAEISAGYQGQSVVIVSPPFVIQYDNQFQGMLFVITDFSNSLMEFVASILSSDASDNSLTLSKAVPSVGAVDPIPFLIIPAGMGDASRALLLYEGG